MYDKMCQDFYWPHIANDVYATVRDCQYCTRNYRTNRKQSKLRQFSPNSLLEFVAIDILGPLPNTKSGNQFVVVMIDR